MYVNIMYVWVVPFLLGKGADVEIKYTFADFAVSHPAAALSGLVGGALQLRVSRVDGMGGWTATGIANESGMAVNRHGGDFLVGGKREKL